MRQEFTFLKKKYTIVTPAWRIEGDVWALNYEILEGNQVIARIRKKIFSWMDAYEIDIVEEDYTELLLGIVIAVNNSKISKTTVKYKLAKYILHSAESD